MLDTLPVLSGPTAYTDTTGGKLRQFVDQLLGQRDRVKGEQDHYNAILAAAQAEGFDKKVLQDLVKRLVADETTVKRHDELLDLYEATYHNARTGYQG
jgi:uncharacterized protein (UPF0335 family)